MIESAAKPKPTQNAPPPRFPRSTMEEEGRAGSGVAQEVDEDVYDHRMAETGRKRGGTDLGGRCREVDIVALAAVARGHVRGVIRRHRRRRSYRLASLAATVAVGS